MQRLTESLAIDRRAELNARNLYDELMQIRDQQRRDRETAYPIVGESSIPWEINPQGIMRWYMAPTMTDTVMQTYLLYVQRIPVGSRSGKQLTQGGQLAFVWKGARGFSVVDDERHDWGTYDLIQIPRRPAGSVVQHFNDGEDDVQLICCAPNSVFSASVDRGSGFEQIENCPEFGRTDIELLD